MANHRKLTRRDFIKIAGAGLGGVILSCRQSTKLTEIPVTSQPPIPSATTLPPGVTADTILVNGSVMTVNASNDIVQGIAIKRDRILKTGTEKDIRALAGPQTKIVELNGRAVTPGFIDAHLHFRIWGLQNVYYTPFLPPDVKDIAGLQRVLADHVKSLQPGEWVMGYYLTLKDAQIPTKEDLDAVAKSNPVFIMHIGGHWGTANSAAMQVAGITNNTHSPEGGIIEKVNGELTGVFYNHRAMDVLRIYAPPVSTGVVSDAILDTQKLMASCGITGFHDNNIREVEHIKLYQDLTAEGKLYLRNHLYLTLEWPSDMDKIDLVQSNDNEISRFAGYKFLIDGQGPTAYCHQAHNGAEYRLPTWDPEQFKEVINTLHNTGLQICTHCIGDAAADLTLEAYEAAMNANPRSDPRHRLEHAILTTAAATEKMRDLGVAVCTQPAFIYLFGAGWESLFGSERMERILVTREWLDAGVHVSISSDAPSTPLYYPQATLAGAMTRYTITEKVIGTDQTLTFTEALRAHTYEAAYAGHMEDVTGSLEAGKYADLVVWPGDPAKIKLADLAQLDTVDLTMVGGHVVYQNA